MDIRLENITKAFGGKEVKNKLSMNIVSKSFTTLLDPSGCLYRTWTDIRQISVGQQQRISFESPILMVPEYILFDESLLALEAMLREERRDKLKSLVSEHCKTSVFVIHDQTKAT